MKNQDHPLIEKLSSMIFGKQYKDELDQKILNNKILWLLFLLMLLWNSFITNGYLSLRDTNHVKITMPAINYHTGEYKIGNDFANEDFYMAWGMYDIITYMTKYDKKNVHKNIAKIANKMPEDEYLNKKEQIDSLIALIQDNNVKAIYNIPSDEWKVMKQEGENKYGKEVFKVTAKGTMVKNYGVDYADEPKFCETSISYFRKGGMTYVQDFYTDCF